MTSRPAELMERAGAVRGEVVCGRYAPSPTGDLHLGNLRTALAAWLQARLMNGVFVLRMEDLDRPRNRTGSAAKIIHDLCRLGLDWDEGPDNGGPLGPYTQLERNVFYRAAFDCLRDRARLFPCFCSRKDIREAASAPHGAGIVYPGTCREMDPNVNHAGAPAWRFAVNDSRVCFHDCLQGIQRQDLGREVGHFVVRRRDEVFAYQLAVVVDDALMGVTDVVRGEDLMESTPRQIALQEALELPTPRYWHVPVLHDDQGERMSKRDGSASLDEYCAAGGTVESLVGRFAAELNLVDSNESLSAVELLSGLDKAALLRCSL
jgi:glutamyl-tRNA synthetase